MDHPPADRGPQRFFRTLRGRLILWFVLLPLIPLVAGGFLAQWVGRKTIEEQVSRDLLHVARGSRQATTHFLELHAEGIRQIAAWKMFSQISSSPAPALRAEVQEHIERILDKATGLLSLSVLDRQGKVFASTRRDLVGQELSQSAALSGAYRDVSFSEVYRDARSGRPAMRLLAPIVVHRESPSLQRGASPVRRTPDSFGAAGGAEVGGTVLAEVNITSLAEIIGVREGLGRTGEVVVFDSDRRFVVPPQRTPDAFLIRANQGWGISEALAGREGTRIYSDYRGVEVIGAYVPLPQYRWALVAKMDVAEAFAPLRRLTWLFLGLMAAGGLIVSGGAVLVARRIADPISEVAQAAAFVGAGSSASSTGRQPCLPAVVARTPRGSEVETLVVAFQDMTARLDQGADRLNALRELCLTVASSLEVQRVFDHAVQGIRNVLDVPLAHIWTVDETSQRLIVRASAGIEEPCPASTVGLQMGEGLVGWVAEHRTPTRILDLSTDPRPVHRDWLARLRLVSQMGVPIVMPLRQANGGGSPILGVLEVFTRVARKFRDDELDLLAAFANEVAITMQNARVFEAERRRADELQAVMEVSRDVVGEQSLEALFLQVVTRAVALTRAHSGTLYMWEESEQVLVPRAWVNLGDFMAAVCYPLGRGLTGAAAEEGQGLIWNDYQADPRHDQQLLRQVPLVACMAAPLRSRDQLLGVLTLNHTEPGRQFTPEDLRLLETFASQMAIAIENARLYQEISARRQELESRVREMKCLDEITRHLAQSLDLDEVLERITRDGLRLLGMTDCWVNLLSEDGKELQCMAAVGRNAETFRQVNVSLDQPFLSVRALRENRVVVTEDHARDCPVEERHRKGAGMKAAIHAPIRAQGGPIGTVSFADTEEKRAFSEQEVRLAQRLADQAAIAIENARLHRSAVRRGAEIEALLRATRSVMAELDLQGILERIVAEAAQITGSQHVRVLLMDQRDGILRLGAPKGTAMPPGFQIPLDASLSGLAAKTGQPVFSEDVANDPRSIFAEWDREVGYVTYLGLPITIRDEVFGVLAFNTTFPRRYSPEDLAYLTSFADQAAIAIEHARLFAELNRSYHDLRRAQDGLIRSEKLRALGQIAAGIAHELNNMLTAILGQAELLRRGVTDPEGQAALDTLLTAATDGAHVVRRLQSFAHQQPTGVLIPCDLTAAVREALEITRPRWRDEPQRHGRVIEVRTALEEVPPILGHGPEIRQVLINLILNAVDAMPDGGTLTIRMRATGGAGESENGRVGDWEREGTGGPEKRGIGEVAPTPPFPHSPTHVVVEVTDTGIGMSEEVLRQIFDPFFTTKGVRGTGLGLSVVYGIMERHGGHIEVVSDPGRGTSFTLRFQAAAAGALAAPEIPLRPGPPRRILLIDDDPMVRRTVANLLRSAGHTVTVADGGATGLACLTEAPVDVVLTDLGMPEVTGWDVAREVKTREPRLPVILLTGWGDQLAVEADESASPKESEILPIGGLVDRVLGKPFRLEELLAVIADLTAPPTTELAREPPGPSP